MTEVHFRLPSKAPYAYVEVRGTPEEIAQIDYEMLAALFANSLYAFGKSERQAIDLIAGGAAPAAPVAPASEPMYQEPKFTLKAAEKAIVDGLGATKLVEVTREDLKQKPWEKAKPSAKLDIDPDFF